MMRVRRRQADPPARRRLLQPPGQRRQPVHHQPARRRRPDPPAQRDRQRRRRLGPVLRHPARGRSSTASRRSACSAGRRPPTTSTGACSNEYVKNSRQEIQLHQAANHRLTDRRVRRPAPGLSTGRSQGPSASSGRSPIERCSRVSRWQREVRVIARWPICPVDNAFVKVTEVRSDQGCATHHDVLAATRPGPAGSPWAPACSTRCSRAQSSSLAGWPRWTSSVEVG